ncbi:hypothetical protein HNR42_001091 [Deinobacterium chartae]|uniref:Uncharacterized protein n=1 Tax=Deinobacterium chartae TaxID=521158 RepID=A0A841HYE0_9DEIO|nr:hypothetical protein [Deinobacterium chartae]MBB6097674.1 hypothetical protein [Deinobacterium chartae]
MHHDNGKKSFGFGEVWWDLGIVNTEVLEWLEEMDRMGRQPIQNYHWLAFQRYIQSHDSIPGSQLDALYTLAGQQESPSLGHAMKLAILHREKLPGSVLERATRDAAETVRAKAMERMNE